MSNKLFSIFKEQFKNVIPESIKARGKIFLNYKYYNDKMKYINEVKNECSYLFGTPTHRNLGDHLITVAEQKFLASIESRIIVEVPTEFYLLYRDKLIETIPKYATIYINGGGWLGSLWPRDEEIFEDILSSFHNNRIIVFPQTIYIEENERSVMVYKSQEIYNRCSDLTLCLRDRNSYIFATQNYSNVNLVLSPDIALFYKNYLIGMQKKSLKNKLVGFCIRNDREKKETDSINKIRGLCEKCGYKKIELSTIANHPVFEQYRSEVLAHLMEEFCECSIIVTDRLHGMIISYLLDIPCIVFDNVTGKVQGVYQTWLYQTESILLMRDTIKDKQIIDFLANPPHNFNKSDVLLETQFEILKSKLG